MEEVQTIGHDVWDEQGAPPYYTAPTAPTVTESNSLDERLAAYEEALHVAGLIFGASLYGQVGIDACDTVVALDYAHLHDATAPSERRWVGTYDPTRRTIITPAEAQHCHQSRTTRLTQRLHHWLSSAVG